MVHALDDFLLIHHLSRSHIVVCQLLAILAQLLKLYPLRVCQEQQIHRLMHRLKLHFLVIVYKQEPVILSDYQLRQLSLCSFYPQLLQQRHTDSLQQKILPSLCHQLLRQSLHLQRHFLCIFLPLYHFACKVTKLFPILQTFTSLANTLCT